MSERTTNTLLGAFVIGGLIVMVALILSVLGQGWGRDGQKVRMVFDGSITGLNIGAPVALRGVEIGQVTDIRVRLDDVKGLNLVMEVDAELDASRIQKDLSALSVIDQNMVEAGLRAQLNSQSLLTGLLYVQLDFHPETEVTLRSLTDERFEIPTIPSPLDRFVQDLDELNLKALANDLQAIAKSVRSIAGGETFANLPAQLSETLETTTRTADTLEASINALMPEITDTLNDTRSALNTINEQLPLLAGQITHDLEQTERALESFTATSEQIAATLDNDSPLLLTMTSTLREIERTSRTLNQLARTLEEQPQSLILGRKPPSEEP
jgi:paraquat-inducible protein B